MYAIEDKLLEAAARHNTTCTRPTYHDSKWRCGNGHTWTHESSIYHGDELGECLQCTVACRQCKTAVPKGDYTMRGNKRLVTCDACLAASKAKRQKTAEAKAAEQERLRPLRPVCAINDMQEDVLVAIVRHSCDIIKCRNPWIVARGTCHKLRTALDNEAWEHLKLTRAGPADLAWFGAGLCRPCPGWKGLENNMCLPFAVYGGSHWVTLADARRASLQMYGSRANMARFAAKHLCAHGGDVSVQIVNKVFRDLLQASLASGKPLVPDIDDD
jgi:hypothetical protein